jgi:hypothetical protein
MKKEIVQREIMEYVQIQAQKETSFQINHL